MSRDIPSDLVLGPPLRQRVAVSGFFSGAGCADLTDPCSVEKTNEKFGPFPFVLSYLTFAFEYEGSIGSGNSEKKIL